MQTARTVSELRARISAWKAAGECVAFVPTMGNLHAGHIRLVERARELADRVVVSIFVNPAQFGPGEDFERYPRTEEADAAKLAAAGAHLVFLPSVEEMYPGGAQSTTIVEVPGVSDILCGEFRPGHFRGVATVVTRLFNMVQPDAAIFGEKDFQQLMVIRRMVRDLAFPVEIVGEPTMREADGLAMSSRNQYLSPEERAKAPFLYQLLTRTAERLKQGETDIAALEEDALTALKKNGFRPDYFAIRRAENLEKSAAGDREQVILVAAHLGKARLIDNLRVQI